MRTAKRFAILLLALNLVFLTGCWSYREVDTMSMVSGFAIDSGKNGYKYHITYEFLDLTDAKMGSKLIESDGDTIYDCARNALGKTDKKLFFSDCGVIVISNQLAAQGIAPLLDWIMRDYEPRIDLNLIISKEKTAAEILQQKPVAGQLISLEIGNILDQSAVNLCEAPIPELHEAINQLAEAGDSLTLPAIKISDEQSGKILKLDGTAIFKSDKLVGYLNGIESKYFLYAIGKVKGGLLVTSPKNDKTNITLQVLDSKTKVTPVIKNNDLTVNIEMKVNAILDEDQTSADYTSVSGLKEAEESTNKTLEYGVDTVIKKVQSQYGSDIFGFGSSGHKDDPVWWKKVKSNWDDSFRKVKYTITADVTIINTSYIKTKIKVGD